MTAPARTLILPAPLAARILDHAARASAAECCGLLIGGGEGDIRVAEIAPAANCAADPTRRFEIDPQVQFDWLRRLRGSRRRIVGHYHSHPGGPATPSAHDLAMAHDPEAIWVIAVPRPLARLAAFQCPDPARGFVPVPITTDVS